METLKSMKISLQTILTSVALTCLLAAVDAHETHQPTGLIPPNSLWKYDDDGVLDMGWQMFDFDDSTWGESKAPLGYGEQYLNQTYLKSGQVDYFLRRDFMVKDRTAVASLTLRVRYDDAFVLYLNGNELMRTHP